MSDWKPPAGYNPDLTEKEYLSLKNTLEEPMKREGEKMLRERQRKEKELEKTEKAATVISYGRRTAADILKTDYPPIQWVVPNIIPEGLSKIDGGPKVGKSWLALHLATAVSSGGCFMGSIHVEKREVLYLALEDSERRLKSRLLKQQGIGNDKFFIETAVSWKGGLIALIAYLKQYPATGLVIVDTLFMFSPMADTNKYADTYTPVSAIQKIATETGVPIVLIHHTRKGARGDNGEGWADEGMGSQGINGACDTIILLKKPDGKPEGTMRIKGRDVEESCYNVIFDRDICTWRIIGEGEIVRADPKAQAEILLLLENAGQEGMAPKEIQKALGLTPSATSNRLKAVEGKTTKVNGRYIISHFHDNSQMNKSEIMNFTNTHTTKESEKMNSEPEKELDIY